MHAIIVNLIASFNRIFHSTHEYQNIETLSSTIIADKNNEKLQLKRESQYTTLIAITVIEISEQSQLQTPKPKQSQALILGRHMQVTQRRSPRPQQCNSTNANHNNSWTTRSLYWCPIQNSRNAVTQPGLNQIVWSIFMAILSKSASIVCLSWNNSKNKIKPRKPGM